MQFKDYYEVMGVARDATQDEIKRSYRKLARKYHPDVSDAPDAEQRFKEMGEAYEVLKDPEKRAAYDRLGENWRAGEDFRPPPGWDQGFEFHGGEFTGADAADFSDFFESLFGQGGGRRGGGGSRGAFRMRGEDSHAKVTIDLEDAYRGVEQTLALRHAELGPDGRPQLKERTLKVRIPKGVHAGQLIRLAGQGSPGVGGGAAGDLFLEVAFRPHSRYSMEGRDVFLDLPVAPWEAALGATVEVSTPGGRLDLKIPAGSSGGRKLRLKGQGIPGTTPGDLYVVIRIVVPPADSDAARDAYRELERATGFDPRATVG